MANPEVAKLKKRVVQVKCANCAQFNPRESYCEKREIYLDGKTSNCEDFIPAKLKEKTNGKNT